MIFVDTSFFFALASVKDPDHQRVVETFREFEGKNLPQSLVTTNHVVSECITLARTRISHSAAAGMGEWLYSETIAQIHWSTSEEEKAAFAELRKHKDKIYSAVDCLSFVVMERFGIHQALTLDSDFTHKFVALPGPRPQR